MAGLVTSLFISLPPKPQSIAPTLKPLNLNAISLADVKAQKQRFNKLPIDDQFQAKNHQDNQRSSKQTTKQEVNRKKRQTFQEIDLSECSLLESLRCFQQCYINAFVLCVLSGISMQTCQLVFVNRIRQDEVVDCIEQIVEAFTATEPFCVPWYMWSRYYDPKSIGQGGTEDRTQTCFNVLRYMLV